MELQRCLFAQISKHQYCIWMFFISCFEKLCGNNDRLKKTVVFKAAMKFFKWSSFIYSVLFSIKPGHHFTKWIEIWSSLTSTKVVIDFIVYQEDLTMSPSTYTDKYSATKSFFFLWWKMNTKGKGVVALFGCDQKKWMVFLEEMGRHREVTKGQGCQMESSFFLPEGLNGLTEIVKHIFLV